MIPIFNFQRFRIFAAALGPDHPKFFAPKVIASSPKVLVSEWMAGTPMSRVIAEGDKPQRDRAGLLLAEFLLSNGLLTPVDLAAARTAALANERSGKSELARQRLQYRVKKKAPGGGPAG